MTHWSVRGLLHVCIVRVNVVEDTCVVQHYINDYYVPMVDCTCIRLLYLCINLRFLYFN